MSPLEATGAPFLHPPAAGPPPGNLVECTPLSWSRNGTEVSFSFIFAPKVSFQLNLHPVAKKKLHTWKCRVRVDPDYNLS